MLSPFTKVLAQATLLKVYAGRQQTAWFIPWMQLILGIFPWSIIPIDIKILIYEIDQILTAVRQQIINLTWSVSPAIYPQAQACSWFGSIEGCLIRYLPQYFQPRLSVKNNGQFLHGISVKIYSNQSDEWACADMPFMCILKPNG